MSGALFAVFAAGAQGAINGSLPNGSAAVASGWTLNNDGTYSISGAGAGNWLTPAAAGLALAYEVKVDVTSGSFSTGTTGSYLALSSSRGWSKTVAGSVTFTVTIREIATGIVRSTQAGKTLTTT